MAVKRIKVSNQAQLLIEFPFLQKRIFVQVENERISVTNDKCHHRGGPLHLCYIDKDGISRSPWHDRPVVKPQKTDMISALYWTHKEEITLVASVEADAVWLIRIIKGDN